MRKVKIFLASSNELIVDRDKFELEINQKNKKWVDQQVFLELNRWEDLTAKMSKTRSQDEYNKAIKACDIFVMLAHTKVGRFTEEEFDQALESLMEKGKPDVFTYFKPPSNCTKSNRKDLESLWDFQDKLEALGHFHRPYSDSNELWKLFNNELELFFIEWKPTHQIDHNPELAPIPLVLGSRPFVPISLKGRDEDLKAIRKRFFDEGHPMVSFNGQGGVGKTTLASQYYRDSKDDYKRRIWIYSDNNLSESLISLAGKLNLSFAAHTSTDQKLEEVFEALAELPGTNLMVLDNVNNKKELNGLFFHLRKLESFHILITSRVPEFDMVQPQLVPPLTEENAILLFKEYYSSYDPQEEDYLKKIFLAVDYNTLIIELLAKNVRNINDSKRVYSLIDLWNELNDKGLLNVRTEGKALSPYDLSEKTLQEVITLTYNIADLNKNEEIILANMSLLPAESIPLEFLESALKHVNGLNQSLVNLRDKGWVVQDKDSETYKTSPVIQEIVRERDEKTLFNNSINLIEELARRVKKSKDTEWYVDYDKAYSAVRYSTFLLSYLSEIDYRLYSLSWLVSDFFSTTGDQRDSLTYAEKCLKICRELLFIEPENLKFQNSLSISNEKIGMAYLNLGDSEKALHFFHRRFKQIEQLHSSNRSKASYKNGLAIANEKLGSTLSTLGQLKEALNYFETAALLFEELIQEYPDNIDYNHGLAIAYEKRGETYFAMADLEKAQLYFLRESDMFKKLHKLYPKNIMYKNGLAISYEKLGETYKALGDLDMALEFFELRCKIAKELSIAYPQNVTYKTGLAIAYEKLGDTHVAMGNAEAALSYFNKEMELFKELYEQFRRNIAYKYGLAIAYEKIGNANAALNRIRDAQEYYNKEMSLFEKLNRELPENIAYQHGLAIAYEKLGTTHLKLVDLGKALDLFAKENKLFKQLHKAHPGNVSYKNGLAISYGKLSAAFSAADDQGQAYELIQERIKISQALQEEHPRNVMFKNGLAVSLSKLAELYRDKLGQPKKAIQYIKMCLMHWQELVQMAPNNVGFKNNLEWAKKALKELGQ